MSNRANMKGALKWVIITINIIIVVIVVATLLWSNKTYTSEEDNITEVGFLKCSIYDAENAFFAVDSKNSPSHELKAIFKSNRLDDMVYTFTSTYDSSEATESASASLRTKYNIYMGENYANPESLNPVFSNLGNKLQIALYAEKGKMNNVIARLFFLEPEETVNIARIDIQSLKNIYESKGFSCDYNNKGGK